MKRVRMFVASWCPHCTTAKNMIEELKVENPELVNLPIEIIDIDNEKDKLVGLDFYYVPTFYVDDEKSFEGVPKKDAIKEMLENAL